MILNPEGLPQQLNEGLKPYYWLHSDTQSLRDSYALSIREAARAQGYELSITYANTHTSLAALFENFRSPGLFAPKRFFEWRLEGKWPNQFAPEFAEFLKAQSLLTLSGETAAAPAVCWLIVSDYLSSAQQKTAWYKTVTEHVALMPLWPPTGRAWSLWFERQAKAAKLNIPSAELRRLSDYCGEDIATAGHLLKRLAYAFGTQPLQWADIAPHCVNNAEQDTFQVLDGILLQESDWPKRFAQLHQQQPLLALLGALTYLLRTLITLMSAQAQGQPLSTLLARQPGGPRRKAALTKALGHLSVKQVTALWQALVEIDYGCKHGADTEATHQLYTVLSTLAGIKHVHYSQ